MANVLNKYFINVAAQLKGPAEISDFKHTTEYVNSKVPSDTSFNIPEINSSFVRNFLKSLDVTKATGLDCIGPKILKIAPDVLCPSLSYIINKSLESGIFHNHGSKQKLVLFLNVVPKMMLTITDQSQSYLLCQKLLKNGYISI